LGKAAELIDLDEAGDKRGAHVAGWDVTDYLRDAPDGDATAADLEAILDAVRAGDHDAARQRLMAAVDREAGPAPASEPVEWRGRAYQEALTDELAADGGYKGLAEDVYQLGTEIGDNRVEFVEQFGPDGGALVDLVDGWTGGGNRIEALRTRLDQGDPVLTSAVEAIAAAPPAPVALYRGMGIQSAADEAAWDAVAEGDVLPIDRWHVSSFTESRQHAAFFPDDHAGMEGVMVTVKPGTTPAMPIGAISNSPAEAEWWVARNLRVTKVTKRRTYNEDADAETLWVEIEAEAV